VTTQLGGSGWPVIIGDAPRHRHRPQHVRLRRHHSDARHGGSKAAPRPITGFRFHNAAPHGCVWNQRRRRQSSRTTRLAVNSVITGNWLSGGTASRYPPGNRFQVPFNSRLTAGVAADPLGTGANVARLLPLLETILDGLMIGQPQSPRR
jgi:hypothetical protein